MDANNLLEAFDGAGLDEISEAYETRQDPLVTANGRSGRRTEALTGN
jgi:hypothetical protein